MQLYRFRRQVLNLDTERLLTRGSPVGPYAVLDHLNPAVGTYTGVCDSAGASPSLIGQVRFDTGQRSAHLAYFMLSNPDERAGVTELVEELAIQSGQWGAYHLLADVDEDSPFVDELRQAGFKIFAAQRIWQLPQREPNLPSTAAAPDADFVDPVEELPDSLLNGLWRPASIIDEIPVRSLYQSLVPPLVQAAQSFQFDRMHTLVYRSQGELLAVAQGVYGPQGICFQPLVHPAVKDVRKLLEDFTVHIPRVLGRPVYLSVRSYQAWLERALEDLGCSATPRQTLLVKHLALIQRAPVFNGVHATLEKYSPEPTAPFANFIQWGSRNKMKKPRH